jgi:hypothetical protein
MNLIMLETDGLPNTLTYNFYATPGTISTLSLNTTSNCVDGSSGNGLTYAKGGWRTTTSARPWITGISMNTGGSGYMGDEADPAAESCQEDDSGRRTLRAARAGDDSQANVADRWIFSHEIPNLDILGASLMGPAAPAILR